MPISTVIYLIPPKDVTLRPTMGHHAHAAFLSILKLADAQKAEEIHAISTQKPFTVSPLIGKAQRHGDRLLIRAGTQCWLRFTFLDDDLFASFGNAFLTQQLPQIRLGQATFQLSRLVASNAETQSWSGNTTYDALNRAAQTQKRLHIRLYSPTAFRQMTPHGQKTRNQAGIDLVRCYQSWINKWNAFAPTPIDKPKLLAFIDMHAVLIRYNTQTQMLDFGRHKEIGFVGSCTYECREDWGFYDDEEGPQPLPEGAVPPLDADLLRQANLLTDFAFYCGTGYKTTMGMGQTRRL